MDIPDKIVIKKIDEAQRYFLLQILAKEKNVYDASFLSSAFYAVNVFFYFEYKSQSFLKRFYHIFFLLNDIISYLILTLSFIIVSFCVKLALKYAHLGKAIPVAQRASYTSCYICQTPPQKCSQLEQLAYEKRIVFL